MQGAGPLAQKIRAKSARTKRTSDGAESMHVLKCVIQCNVLNGLSSEPRTDGRCLNSLDRWASLPLEVPCALLLRSSFRVFRPAHHPCVRAQPSLSRHLRTPQLYIHPWPCAMSGVRHVLRVLPPPCRHFHTSVSSLLSVGDVFEQRRVFGEAEVRSFCETTGDANPIHWSQAS